MPAAQRTDPSKPGTPAWEVLELDHPDHLECYHCKKLHAITDVLAHPEWWLECRRGERKLRVADYIHPNFDLLILRILMKQHRQGKNSEPLLELLKYRGEATIEDAQVKRFIATPKIVNGSLLMLSQTEYVVPLVQGSNQEYLLHRNLLKCPHRSRWNLRNAVAAHRVRQWVKKLSTFETGRRENIIDFHCDFCPTEFEVSLERFEGLGVVLRTCKWQDIGPALSPIDEDLPPVTSHGLSTTATRNL